MNAEDVRDQGSDADDSGVPEATSSTEATDSAEITSNAETADAAEGMNLTDLLTDLGKAAQDTAATISDTVGDGEAAVRAGARGGGGHRPAASTAGGGYRSRCRLRARPVAAWFRSER